MKKINFLLGVLLVGVFGVYLFFENNLNRSSSTLYAVYGCVTSSECLGDTFCKNGVCCAPSDTSCGGETNRDCVYAFECSDDETWDGCYCLSGTSGGSSTPTSTGSDGSDNSNVDTPTSTPVPTLPPVNGTCGEDVGTCNSGTFSLVSDTDEKTNWNCLGINGGSNANCVYYKQQMSWFQVNNGNVLSEGVVVNYVPGTTCQSDTYDCAATVNNGAIYSKSRVSISGYDEAEGIEDNNFSFKTYAYNQLKSDYFGSKGVGVVFDGVDDGWLNIKETTGVIFVDGDLEINESLVTNNFVMIIASGTITIDPSVDEVDAILVGGKVVAAVDEDSGKNVNQLVINGMVHGVSGVEFNRSLDPEAEINNNNSPSVVVNYKPELLFSVPQELAKSFSNWKVN